MQGVLGQLRLQAPRKHSYTKRDSRSRLHQRLAHKRHCAKKRRPGYRRRVYLHHHRSGCQGPCSCDLYLRSASLVEFNYDERRIEAIVSKAEARFRSRFADAVKQIRSSVKLEELEILIAQRRFDEAFTRAELAAANLSNAYISAYILAAEDVMSFVSSSLGITITFDQVNARAVSQMQDASLRLIREFTTGQRAATRVALIEGVTAGVNPREQALLFRQSIGLTAHQTRAVANYRRLLQQGSAQALQRALRDRRFDGSVAQAVSGQKPLTDAQIDRMVERYYTRSLAARAQTIARTESLTAVHQGSDQAFMQAIQQAVISDDLSQQWHTGGDGRVRHPSHTLMNGQIRSFGKPFLSGTGNLLRYPGDPSAPAHDVIRCRCVKSTRFASDMADDVA